MAQDEQERFKVIAAATLAEFAAMCAKDLSLGNAYMDARDLWHGASTDAERDTANDAFALVLERAAGKRGSGYTAEEVDVLIMLRNRTPRFGES